MFQGAMFTWSSKIYFFDEKKNPPWIWHVIFFVDFNKTCLKFWCEIVTNIALISWTFNILILSYLMIAAVPLIMSFSLLNANKIVALTVWLVLQEITFSLFAVAVRILIKAQFGFIVRDSDTRWITIKVFLTKESLPKEFKLMKLDNYLWKCINADPHFFFSREDNEIKTAVDSPDWGNFFRGRETM